jgi:hypothetical protein
VSWTVAAFVKPIVVTSQAGLIVGTFQPGNGGYGVFVSGLTGTLIFVRGDSGGTKTLIGPDLTLSAWSFVVAVYGTTNGLARLYVNGALAATQTSVQGLSSASTPRLGGNGTAGPVYNSFNGGVDEVTIWGEALSETEIAALATAAGY